ncbi:MAG: glycosyltransferase [bacterium]
MNANAAPLPKRKILHLVEAFGGGVYFFLRDLLNRPELEQFDFEIFYGVRCKLDEHQLKNDFPKAKLVYWPHVQREIRPYLDIKALCGAYRMIQDSNPDVIHCHSSKAGVLGRASAVLAGKRNSIVYSPHGLSFLKLDDPQWKRSFYKYIERVFAKMAGIVVGCSPSEVQMLNENKIPAKLIQNGVLYPALPVERKFDHPIRIVTVGRINVQKNPSLFNEIAEAMPELEFLWVGDGDLRDSLTAKNIRITGWRPREEISRILKDAHLYLSTSLWEGLPLSVLEGMANGLPLLLKDCVGNVDLVKKGNGYLFREKDEAILKLKEMVSNPSSLEYKGKVSQQVLRESFSIEEMARSYRKLYSEMVAR